MENNLPTNFTNLLLALQYRKTYQRALAMAKEKFNIKQTNIEDLTPFKTLELYRTVVKKFYMNRTQITEGSWFQNELRIYLWLVIGYLFIHKKRLEEMDNDDWTYFSSIFHQRPSVSFQFQALSLLLNYKSPKWSSNEIDLLQTIIKQKKFRNKWNSIARQLFIRSNKQNYRTPKQCRQRWLNYLDPAKKKTGWAKDEDLALLKTVIHEGKKWSTVVKVLKGTRTEHMVKNRYKSMIAIEMKKQQHAQEAQTVLKLIRQLQKQLFDNKQSPICGPNALLKIQYHQSSTENIAGKQECLQKTATEYVENLQGYLNMNFCRNGNNFYGSPSMFQGMQLVSYNSPMSDHLHQLQQSKSRVLNLGQVSDQNQFLMSHEQIQGYMLFEGKDKQSLMKDEQAEEKGVEAHEAQDYLEKAQKINYFSEEFNDCFH